MKPEENTIKNWSSCPECRGTGKKNRRLSKKALRMHQLALVEFQNTYPSHSLPMRPKGALYSCVKCSGSGLIQTSGSKIVSSEKLPHIAIIGGGIGGIALAVACFHRGIPYSIYERDTDFNSRAQGYGLTLQQASKAIRGLGIESVAESVISTRHLVHDTDGQIVGEWGARKWLAAVSKSITKKTNVHLPRQSLRQALLDQLPPDNGIHWGHQLIDLQSLKNGVELHFQVDAAQSVSHADLVIGADGIRSAVRRLLFGEDIAPLQYLGCMVILGICPLSAVEALECNLLDSATVFQTANGTERIYMMPYTTDSIMWQLSFPMQELDAKKLSVQGATALKAVACSRTKWHTPIPEILNASPESAISGYPVYDRQLLQSSWFEKAGPVTLIGDAAHPMSPFKGQGANQALLDALQLARSIFTHAKEKDLTQNIDWRTAVLHDFEIEMIARSTVKVQDSAAAAVFLHTDMALYPGNEPRKLRRYSKIEPTELDLNLKSL